MLVGQLVESLDKAQDYVADVDNQELARVYNHYSQQSYFQYLKSCDYSRDFKYACDKICRACLTEIKSRGVPYHVNVGDYYKQIILG